MNNLDTNRALVIPESLIPIIYFEGQKLNHIEFLQNIQRFYLGSYEQDYAFSMLLHTGSIAYDALIFAVSCLDTLYRNDCVSSFCQNETEIGSMVVYTDETGANPKFYRYRGVETHLSQGGFLYLEDKSKSVRSSLKQQKNQLENSRKFPISTFNWNCLAKVSDEFKPGVNRKEGRANIFYKFCKSQLGMKAPPIHGQYNLAAVWVMNKKKAQRLINGISFKFEGQQVDLLDLIPISYCTAENENFERNNWFLESGGMIKITSQLEIADNLCSKLNNAHLFLMDDQRFRTDPQKLCQMIYGRRSAKYFLLSLKNFNSFNSFDAAQMLLEHADACSQRVNSLILSKEYLSSCTCINELGSSDILRSLSSELKDILHFEFITKDVKTSFDMDEIADFYKNIQSFKEKDLNSEGLLFIRIVNHIWRLARNSIVPLSILEKDERNVIEVSKDKLLDSFYDLPRRLQEDATKIQKNIENLVNSIWITRPNKLYRLRDQIAKIGNWDRAALIVPTKYMKETIVSQKLNVYGGREAEVFTPRKFPTDQKFDWVFCLASEYNQGESFVPFLCTNAKHVVILQYEFERRSLDVVYSIFKKKLNQLSQLFSITSEDEKFKDIRSEIESLQLQSSEIDAVFNHYEDLLFIKRLTSINGNGTAAQIAAKVDFLDGRKAYFTKKYRPYVFNEQNEIEECSLETLSQDSVLVFTKNESAHDIVEMLLSRYILNKPGYTKQTQIYNDAKKWKEFLYLIKDDQGWSVKDLNKKLKLYGCTVGEAAIRNWLDQDLNIVGPREERTFLSLSKLANKYGYEFDAERCHHACNELRYIRVKILKAIGSAALKMTAKNAHWHNNSEDMTVEHKFMGLIMEKANELFDLGVISSFKLLNQPIEIPLQYANRPISRDMSYES